MVKLVKQADFGPKIRSKRLSLFSRRDIEVLFGLSPNAATMLLHRYSKRGIIVRVKRGMYAVEGAVPPELYIANQLYSPSYISREFALSYHRVIPETVYEITPLRHEIRAIRTIRKCTLPPYDAKSVYRIHLEKRRGFTFSIADPEKGVRGYAHYRVLFGMKPLSRFNKERVNPKKALRYAKLFGNRKLVGILKRTLSIHD